MSDKPIVLMDMDGVMTDHTSEFLELINHEFDTAYTYEQVTDFDYSVLTDGQRDMMYSLWETCDYNRCHLTDEQLDTLDGLRSFSRVIACSSPFLGHVQSKYQFLHDYFNRKDIILASDKTLVQGDILIDDSPYNIRDFQKAGRHVIIYDRPWNADLLGPRVRTFDHIGPLVVDILIEEDRFDIEI